MISAESRLYRWDTTEVHSTSVSDVSTIVPDFHGRCLRRALDHKVRHLRKILSEDEDITTELDRVVCRLMKLALRTSKGRQAPPPTRWMQCKLLDLLTLTEKAIGRRKKRFLESYPLNGFEFALHGNRQQELELEQDIRVNEIVDKYRHLIQPVEKTTNTEYTNCPVIDIDIEDDFLSTTSNEFLKDYEYIKGISPSLVIAQPVFSSETFEPEKSPSKDNPLERTKAWLDEDVEVVPCAKHEINFDNISSGDTDHSIPNARHKHKKPNNKHKTNSNKIIRKLESTLCKTSESKISNSKIKRVDKHKRKTSSTLITTKVAKKKSSYNNLVKYPGGKSSSAEYENYVVRSKNKRKEHQSVNVSASKPIPESLIDLCHPELKVEKCIEELKATNNTDEANNIIIFNQPSCNISATQEDFFIDIVMQDFEETIALRRTIGTDAEKVPEIIEKDLVKTFSNDIDENLCTKHQVSTENVQSQTIFLIDINEPSTSKGIRHNLSTDVQCGPDTLSTYPMLSTSTSLVPHVFTAGIKIRDVVVDTKVKGTDFGTSTQDNNNSTMIAPRLRSVGIKIKDSDVNICTKTCSTMTIHDSVVQPTATITDIQIARSPATNSNVSSPETKLIKPISSTLKIEDSGSEFCAPSIASSSKTLSYFMNISKNTSIVLIESASKEDEMTEKISTSKYAQRRLCCGGVHVHSYRDKQVSEDIVYQGEWQRYRPKALARKKTYNIVSSRKNNEAVNRKKKENWKEKKGNSKEKIAIRRHDNKEIKAETRKLIQMQNAKLHKVKQEDVTKDETKKRLVTNSIIISPKNAVKIPRPIKKVSKVASKIALSVIASKKLISTSILKKPEILPIVTVEKDDHTPQKLKKSYIPLYLKRTTQISASSNKNNLNKSIDSAYDMKENIGKIANNIAPLARSKTDEIRKDLLKFSDEVRENISYVVFRNELEKKIESPDEQTSENTRNQNKCTAKQLECMVKRSHSPQSLNSSTCSSPNSIATVRAASVRIKNMSNRRHSASTYKSSLNNSESDNTSPTKNKKNVKRSKSAKKSESKDIDNKENIPESTKNFASKDKVSKSAFLSRHKNVYIAQLKTESSSTGNTLSRNKAQLSNKSNIKMPAPRDTQEQQRSTTSPPLLRKRSVKSGSSSNFETQSESHGSSDSTNMVLVLEPQPTYKVVSGTQNISHILPDECAAKNDSSVLAQWVQNSSLHSHSSNILNFMRQLLEETIDQIISTHAHNVRHIDSKTVILSREHNQKAKMDKIWSPGSKTFVSTDESFNSSFLENDIENALERTFTSVRGDDSIFSLNENRITVTDFDLLSFKSITSVSKYSEYFLADNEFSISQEVEPAQSQSTTSVRDIFERKEPHLVQNTVGALAVQAFSGYSLNAELVAGDQPDPIARIDSETGSLALEFTRQATSEELFISGRSSDSYESCLIEDDAVVPNWLFQIISRQLSVEEDPEPVLGPLGPLAEPLYDANGNLIEPALVGVGAGAGDGRGIHSNHSQDSSGRGTSLSSSDTSTGPQSEVSAILIDPSAFTAQFELMQAPNASSGLAPVEPAWPSNSSGSQGTYRIDDDTGTLIGGRSNRRRSANGASDVDADISSIDTDVPDSSDN